MKQLKTFLVAALLGAVVGNSTAQVTVISSGYCGAEIYNLSWVLTSDSVLTISGSGNMTGYYSAWENYPPWCPMSGVDNSLIKTVIIGDSVTSIGNEAFGGCINLTSVNIGNSVTRIGGGAFSYCVNLASITIYAITPPISKGDILGGTVFYEVPNTLSVYVPCGSISDYQDSAGWNRFSNYYTINTDTTYYSASFCIGSTYTDSNFANLTQAGTYYGRLQSVNGCDSLVVLALNTISKDTTTITASICEGEIYQENGFYETESGIYTQELQNIYTCDSLVILNLYVASKDTISIFDTINSGEVYQKYGFYETEAGIYTQNLQNINSCDSIIELTLVVTSVGIVETGRAPSLQIYPNPTTGQLTINNEQLTIEIIEIYNMVGQLVQSKIVNLQSKINIDISHLHSGIYFIKINKITKKLIKL